MRVVLGLDAGIAQTNQLSRTVTFPLGYSTFNYTPDKKNSSFARYGVSLGRRLVFDSLNSIIIGLGYHQLSSRDVKGTLQQGIFPPFYSANYQYTIQMSQLLAEVKVQREWHEKFYPYLTAGIGGAYNKAKNFSTTVPGYLTVTPDFSNHNNSSLSYMLGLGIDTLILPNVAVGVGYVFSDLGHVGLGDGSIRNRAVPDYLNQSHLYINTLVAQLHWYF
ncbi:outer membrane protein [Legionella dresdenensis]|uniref:Outer membrane protein n=1 Tax=Legionella dresdenensis TaxID=450200 RepID=A0ABV8CFZ6_9GAMM